MNVVVFGATGPTGRQLVGQALAEGHRVIAAVRRPEGLPPRKGLTVARVDATDPAAVADLLAGARADGGEHTVVLSALGVSYSRRLITLYSTGTRHIIAAMREHGLRRLVVVSSGMVDHDWRPSGSALQRVLGTLLANVLGKTLYTDMRAMEGLVHASGLAWTILRPSGLCDTPAVTDYLLTERFADHWFTARADLAAAMLAQVTDERLVGKVAAVVSPSLRPSTLALVWREAVGKVRPSGRRPAHTVSG